MRVQQNNVGGQADINNSLVHVFACVAAIPSTAIPGPGTASVGNGSSIVGPHPGGNSSTGSAAIPSSPAAAPAAEANVSPKPGVLSSPLPQGTGVHGHDHAQCHCEVLEAQDDSYSTG